MIKECELCGDEFEAKVHNAKFCYKDHVRNCIVCGKKFEIKDNHRPAITCSQSCASSLTHTEKAKQARKRNSLKKHGTEFPFQAEEIKRKIRETHEERWGGIGLASEKLAINMKQILIEKYGVENISQLEEIKKKKREVYYERYGVHNPAAMQVKNYKEWNNLKDFVKDKNLDCLELSKYFEVPISSVRAKVYETKSIKLIEDFYKYSNPELEVKHVLIDLGFKEGLDFFPHNRQEIRPFELDFYLPKCKIAIEVSPTYTHNAKFGWGKEGPGLEKDYHYEKFKLCEEKNIRLITIFDWISIVQLKSILKSKYNLSKSLNMNEYVYKENNLIDEEIAKFTNLNSIETYTHCKYNITTISNEKNILLVAIWLKSGSRSILKYVTFHKDYNRFQLASLLIKEHKESLANTSIKQMVLITNSSIETGDLCKELNFELLKEIKPRINYYNEKYNHHISSTKTINENVDILENNDFLPVYDCGHKVWKLDI